MQRQQGRTWTFQMAVDFVAKALHLANTKLDLDTEEDIEIDRQIRACRKRRNDKDQGKGMPLASVLPYLRPDTVYYPARGITAETIVRYHISVCDDPNKPFYQRAFFPVLDVSGRYVQGWSARSIWPQCPRCRHHHDPCWNQCPPREEYGRFAKWRHSAHFHAERCLYNLWYSRPHIMRTGCAILCEGPGDVWAYEQAGIRNSVAMLGLSLGATQRQMLQAAEALTLIVTVDNDKSALEARAKLAEELNWYFRVFLVTPEKKDIGEMLPDEIRQQMGTLLEQASRREILREHSECGGSES
jgi:5S rRNA maturation endonuclease (ribonuclease M5)